MLGLATIFNYVWIQKNFSVFPQSKNTFSKSFSEMVYVPYFTYLQL